MVSVLEMTDNRHDLPICELSFRGDWTPLNRIFFSQCIQDSDDEQSLSFQQKKKLKRKSCPYRNKKTQRNYIVYEYVSSESEVPASDEFNSADEFENIITSGSSSNNAEIIVSDENGSLDGHKKKVKRSSISNDCKSSTEPKERIFDELQSVDECENRRFSEEAEIIALDDDYERNIKSTSFSDEPEIIASDEYDSYDVTHETRQKEKIVYNEYRSCSDPEVQISEELNSADKPEKKVKRKRIEVKRKRIVYQYDSSSESEEQINDQQKLDDEYENSIQPHQSAVKSKKYTTNKDDSCDEWKIHTSSESTSDECDSSDSCSDYEVSRKKRRNHEFKKRAKQSIKTMKPELAQLSEYEKMVQKNREEKNAFLISLKIMEIREDYKEAVETFNPKRNKKKRNNKREISLPSEDIDSFSEERRGSEVDAKTEKVCRQSARRKSLLNKREDASSRSSKLNNELPSILSFEEAVLKNSVYHDFISEYNESEFKVPKLLENGLVSHFEKMKLQQSQITKLTYSRISSMVVHGSQEKIIICTGDANGQIIFWHVNSDSDICTFRPHLQSVSSLKFHPYFPNVLISSSTDGTMRCGDFEKKIFYRMFKAESCNHFDFLSPTSYLVAHGIGYVSIIDSRSHSKTFEKRHKCSRDVVKTVNLHPINKSYFISAHQMGTVKLWDLRKLNDEPVIDVNCNSGNMISSYFSPVTGNSVLVTLSNTICLLNSSSLSEDFKLKKSVEHVNFVWTPIHATWLPNTEDAFVVGSKSSSRIEIFDDKLSNIFNFTDEHFDSATPINAFHSSLPFLASATKGKVFIFSDIV